MQVKLAVAEVVVFEGRRLTILDFLLPQGLHGAQVQVVVGKGLPHKMAEALGLLVFELSSGSVYNRQSSPGLIFQYNFISKPDDAHCCLICLEVAQEPWQHGECGRLFCKKCLFKFGYEKPCPNCRMESPQYFLDSKSKSIAIVHCIL